MVVSHMQDFGKPNNLLTLWLLKPSCTKTSTVTPHALAASAQPKASSPTTRTRTDSLFLPALGPRLSATKSLPVYQFP